MLKKAMMAAALALLFAGALAQKRQVMLDKVVAVVGSSSILHSEVAEYARQLTAQRRAEGDAAPQFDHRDHGDQQGKDHLPQPAVRQPLQQIHAEHLSDVLAPACAPYP